MPECLVIQLRQKSASESQELALLILEKAFDQFTKKHYKKLTQKFDVNEDQLRSFCGVINIYNFLSDSLKYNRLNDEGILIGRIFINKDNNFFVEGDKELGFLFRDFANQQINEEILDQIINVCMVYTLNFDLYTPNFQNVRLISVHQISTMSMNQKIKTSKRLGFKFSHENK